MAGRQDRHTLGNWRAVLAILLVGAACASAVRAGQRDVSGASARPVREWIRDGIVYEIFTRSFSPEGTFNGITAKLDDLTNLGVTILWLMPIHPSGQERKKGSVGSPYAVRDFYAINPEYGTREDFRRLVTEAHRRGLKVIIDVVANHTAWDSVMMKQPEFYTRDQSGRIVSPYDWSDVADLNYDNPQLREYMLEVLKFWLREFDLDGFRCDVAWLVPTEFWERARRELEAIKPDIVMLAEADSPELLVSAFDLDYAWPFFHTITAVVSGRSPASALRDAWEAERSRLPRGFLRLRFTDNHDERRAIARLGEAGALAAAALVFTLDGVPLLYNGMEAGDTTESGAPALFERLPVFWKTAERRPEFREFFRRIIALRRAHPALRRGATAWLRNSDDARIVTFLRQSSDEELVVAINFSNRPFVGVVEVAGASDFREIGSLQSLSGQGAVAASNNVLPAIALDPWSIRILRREVRR